MPVLSRQFVLDTGFSRQFPRGHLSTVFRLFSRPVVEESSETPHFSSASRRKSVLRQFELSGFHDLKRARQRNSQFGNSQSTPLVEYSESPGSIAQFQLSAFSGKIFPYLPSAGVEPGSSCFARECGTTRPPRQLLDTASNQT